jgi:integrase
LSHVNGIRQDASDSVFKRKRQINGRRLASKKYTIK